MAGRLRWSSVPLGSIGHPVIPSARLRTHLPVGGKQEALPNSAVAVTLAQVAVVVRVEPVWAVLILSPVLPLGPFHLPLGPVVAQLVPLDS